MALDLASCRSGRDGDLDAGERWRRGFGEAEEFLRQGGGLQVRAQEFRSEAAMALPDSAKERERESMFSEGRN